MQSPLCPECGSVMEKDCKAGYWSCPNPACTVIRVRFTYDRNPVPAEIVTATSL